MNPLIHQAFWSDPEIEAADAPTKLTVLWLITNSQTSIIGLCRATPRRFAFETGLPESALDAACVALPRMLVKTAEGIWVRSYIRHQFGGGPKLIRNNCFSAIQAAYLQVREPILQEALLTAYPELAEKKEALGKPYLSPSEGLGRGKRREEKSKTGESRGESATDAEPAADDPLAAEVSPLPADDPPPSPKPAGDPELTADEIAAGIRRCFKTTRAVSAETLHAIANAMPVRASELAQLERFYAEPPNPDDPAMARCVHPSSLGRSLSDQLVKAKTFCARKPLNGKGPGPATESTTEPPPDDLSRFVSSSPDFRNGPGRFPNWETAWVKSSSVRTAYREWKRQPAPRTLAATT